MGNYSTDLHSALQRDNLEQDRDMGMMIFATLIDGEFSPSSRFQIVHEDNINFVTEGYQEFGAVDDLIEQLDSLDDNAGELINYVNDLQFTE